MPAVGKGSTVLVTGVTGYIAAWAAELLLKDGYKVIGTVRDEQKANGLKEMFDEFGDNFHLATVRDLQEQGAFDEVARKVDGILHIASPFHFNTKDVKKDLIQPAVNGTLNLLKAAAQSKTVSRVVVTSSFAAMMDQREAPFTFTEEVWNKSSSVEIEKDNTNSFHGYLASKAEAEQAAWDFVKNEQPSFDLAVINPVYVFGPVVHPVKDANSINTSVGMIFSTLSGKDIPNEGDHQNFVDVRDVARAHVRALQNEEAGGHRHITSAGPFGHGQIAGILKRNFPEAKIQQPKSEELPNTGFTAKSLNAKNLNIDYIPLEKSIVDTAKSIQRFL